MTRRVRKIAARRLRGAGDGGVKWMRGGGRRQEMNFGDDVGGYGGGVGTGEPVCRPTRRRIRIDWREIYNDPRIMVLDAQ